MSKIVFDTENGLASLAAGLGQKIEEAFGLPPAQVQKWEDFKIAVDSLATKVLVKTKHPLLGEQLIERFKLSESAIKHKLDTIVVDTISSANTIYKLELRDRAKRKLNWDDWDAINNSFMQFINSITKYPLTVIMNCHPKTIKDDDSGIIYHGLSLTGQLADEFPKLFDFILHCYSEYDKKDKSTSYYWMTQNDERKLAKDRTDSLDPIIPQDFQLVFKAAEKIGIKHPKILIIGKSGQGKTYSLKTLKGKK